VRFANEQGYETASYMHNWRGYDVYQPVVRVGKICKVGPPLIILVKGG